MIKDPQPSVKTKCLTSPAGGHLEGQWLDPVHVVSVVTDDPGHAGHPGESHGAGGRLHCGLVVVKTALKI